MALRPDLLPALAAFESAARHQNFAHAAEELHLTASAVSHHVRKLEARLGVALFQRHARGVTLTAEGRQLADAASSALADMEGRLRRPARRSRRASSACASPPCTRSPTPGCCRACRDFAAKHPRMRLTFDTEIALTRFDEGGPDLGIRHGPGHWPGLTRIT